MRRYLNGERRPARDTVVHWEQACEATPGTLVALYDGAPASDILPPARARFPRRSAVAAVAVFVALGVVWLLRGGGEPNPNEHPKSVAFHRFTASHVGDVWIRITPAREHTGEFHRVRIRWGELIQAVDLKNLDQSRALFTAKTSPDRILMRVNVKPAATIAFGEGDAPGALDINQRWKKVE